MANQLSPPPGLEFVPWLEGVIQNGWAACACALAVAFYFFRQWRISEDKRFAAMEAQNKLADRVTLVMERLERKAERRP